MYGSGHGNQNSLLKDGRGMGSILPLSLCPLIVTLGCSAPLLFIHSPKPSLIIGLITSHDSNSETPYSFV